MLFYVLRFDTRKKRGKRKRGKKKGRGKERKFLFNEGEKNFYCSGYKTGCDFKLWKKIKVFNQKEVPITKQEAKTLLNKGTILITGLTNKTGKKYKANFKLEVSDKYVNLSLDSFVK